MKKIIALFSIIALLILSGCVNTSAEKMNNDTEKIFTELVQKQEVRMYQDAMDDVEESTLEEYLIRIKNKEYEEGTYIYFGRATCPTCREFVLSNESFSKIDELIYIDTDKMTDTEKEKLENLNITEVPTILKISKGNRTQKVSIEDFNKNVAYK
ncbi:hypothetical protein ACI1UM_10470 [Lactococcus petauri]|uniref:hypothetical protein n=1 Tax=Lactococcus petauri TaxID=1940789 RepID=UPI003852B2D5